METLPAKDEEHLNLLETFHYILSGVITLFAMFPVIHLFMGIIFNLAPEGLMGDQGWILVINASAFFLSGWALATFVLITGRFLAHRRRRTFCIFMAGIECAFMPFGTVLGVFTIIVLTKESVTKLFNGNQAIQSTSVATEFDESF